MGLRELNFLRHRPSMQHLIPRREAPKLQNNFLVPHRNIHALIQKVLLSRTRLTSLGQALLQQNIIVLDQEILSMHVG